MSFLSRREFLKLAALGPYGSVLAACRKRLEGQPSSVATAEVSSIPFGPIVSPSVTVAPKITRTPSPPISENSALVGLSTHLELYDPNKPEEKAAIDAQLDFAASLGAKELRFDFESIGTFLDIIDGQPQWNFSKLDYIVEAAQARGIQVVAMLPQWGYPEALYIKEHPGSIYGEDQYLKPQTPEQYEAFVSAVANYFQEKVIYEIGNEPNIKLFWNTGPNPDQYLDLFIPAYNAIRAVSSSATIITAGLALDENTLEFFNQMLDSGRIPVDDPNLYFGLHPYAWDGLSLADEIDYIDQQISVFRESLATHGYNRDQYALTEFGHPTKPDNTDSEADQAKVIMHVVENYANALLLCIYELTSPDNNRDPENNFGITQSNDGQHLNWKLAAKELQTHLNQQSSIFIKLLSFFDLIGATITSPQPNKNSYRTNLIKKHFHLLKLPEKT